ncbi:MAG: PQQ-like beta-propeller repeat protein [Sedimentisphaerales bacterium]|nr:PQQ-like beta-propeller repeat protein [Sedimentisphaerales bacterium]
MSILKNIKNRIDVVFLGLIIFLFCCGIVTAADWPQFRGPNRDGLCTETGLLKSWPQGGPKLLWELSGLGTGYSSVAVADGKLYTMGDIKIDSEDAQCVIAVDLAAQEILWAAKVGPIHTDQRGGPRCIPTVDDGLVYAVGTSGDLVCIDAATGRVRWKKNLQKDLGGGNNPQWKFSESPLIDGGALLCTPGGHETVMAALNKTNGDLLWKCPMPDIGPKGKPEAGYSSIVISYGAGVKQYVQLTNEGLVSVSEDGKFLWGYNKIANRVANIPTPVVDGDYIFTSTGYQTGSALLKLVRDGQGVKTEEVYWLDKDKFQNTHGGFVKVGDYIYGGHNHNRGVPTCIDMRTGQIMWHAEQPGGGSAAVLHADGNLIFRYEDGVVALIEANPQKYNLKSTFKLPKREGAVRECWAYPVISDGRLYLRHADVLFVYDVKEQ